MSCPEPPAPSSALPAPPATTRSHSVVVGARLIDARTGDVLARFADWPQPYRYLDFPDPGLRLTVERDNVLIEVARPAKGLVLSIDGGDEVGWSDNALDVMPGDPQAPPPIIALLGLICVYLLSFICWKRCARQIICIIRNTTDVLVLRSDFCYRWTFD